MSIRKFLTSVADAYAYDANDNLLFVAKTLLDSSIEASLGSQPVRGGRGNQLQYVYYHTGELNVTLTDTQWNLAMLGATVGDDGGSFGAYVERTVTLTSKTGPLPALSPTPAALSGTTIYGWATGPSGEIVRGTFSGTTFTVEGALTAADGEYCVRYYAAQQSTVGLTIKANMIPKVVKVVLEAQLNSADITSNKIGLVQIIIPRLQLSGAFSISMTADGIANTPLTGMALAHSDAASQGCIGTEAYYATIVEILDNTNWYDNVIGLAIEGGDFSLKDDTSTTLSVWAVPSSGAAFKVLNSNLTFASSNAAAATVSAGGVVTATATSGSSLLRTYITSASSIEAEAWVTAVP